MTDADLAAIYLATHITVEHDGELRSLREIDLDAGATLHVITAWNPGDERPGVHANDAADRRLHHRLVELGFVPVRAVGTDPGSDHHEPGWAVEGLTDDQAREIGAEFGQVAVFRVHDGFQTVIGCGGAWQVSRRY